VAAMLQSVDVGERSLAAYGDVAPDGTLDQLRDVAAGLRGARVLHLSATPYGGGVSELLRSAVPLMNDLGLVVDWKIIRGEAEFFEVTKRIHNALQGSSSPLTERDRGIYESTAQANADALAGETYDFVFVHDPQPAAVASLTAGRGEHWIWRCHIDTSEPDAETWAYLRGFLDPYDRAVFTMSEFVPPDMPIDRVEIFPPAIDPLSPKNRPLDDATAREVLSWIGIETDRPLMTQVSRFDPWKDPMGVIRAYHRLRERFPDLQLAMVGSMALDDPEAWNVYRRIVDASGDDPLIHVFTNLTGIGNIEVNAFQRLSQVIVQLSIREGFGLVVSEAMWKRTPVVAGRAGGIPLQMADGAGGLLVDGPEECADGVAHLLEDPRSARALADFGHDRVHRSFLLPRLILNDLALLGDLAAESGSGPITGRPTLARDPVCGIAIAPGTEAASLDVAGGRELFCSARCRKRFLSGRTEPAPASQAQ
jgi:trehalose synthase